MSLPTEPLRVAAIQAEAVPGEVAANAATAARLVARAVTAGAALAVLPELFLPAYDLEALAAGDHGDVRASDDGVVADERLAALSDVGAAVLIGAAVRHPDGRRTLSSLLVEPGGAVRVGYDKQNLSGPGEQGLFTAGRRGAAIELGGWRLGLGICYDGCFPEHARAATLAGAHAYVCPTAYAVGTEHRRDLYYAARALDNTVYAVTANAVGPGFNGGSAMYDPEGRVLARAPDTGEHVLVADLDPAHLATIRAAHPFLEDLQRAT